MYLKDISLETYESVYKYKTYNLFLSTFQVTIYKINLKRTPKQPPHPEQLNRK